MSKLFVVDGYSILFRTYYSVGDMATTQGTPIGGVFGFARAILTLIQRYSVKNLFITLDSGKKTFRYEMYAEYKANRVSVPENLIPQFAILDEFLESAKIAFHKEDRFEADDIIASITKKEPHDIAIVTSDKDLMQLVNERITCLDFFKGKFYSAQDVIEKFGIKPEQIVDYLALLGDSSDNIPGVKGCGEKGAVNLIKEFGSVEEILANVSKIKNNRLRQSLEQNIENALLSKKLASLHFDLNLPSFNYQISNIDFESLRKFLEKYEMKSLFYLLEKIKSQTKATIALNNNSDVHPVQASLF